MPANIEIKARVAGPRQLEARVSSLADEGPHVLKQHDVFFRVAEGRLKLRMFADRDAELIYYRRDDQSGPGTSRWWRCPVEDPDALRFMLAEALGTLGSVRKVRRLYLIGQTRVHLDEVEDLGHFMELEVVLGDGQAEAEGTRIAGDLMQKLGIRSGDLVETAYVDLLRDRT